MGKSVSRVWGLTLGVAAFAVLSLCAGSPAVAAPAKKAQVIYGNAGRIFSIKADGSGRKILAQGGGTRISPDGHRLLFVGRAKHGAAVMVSRRDGSDPKSIFHDRPKRDIGDFHMAGFREPVWSKSDGRIYLVLVGNMRVKTFDLRAEQVISMKPDGSKREVVFTRVHGRHNFSTEPLSHVDVSPDGRRLLLGAYGFRGIDSPLEIYDRMTGEMRVLRQHASGGRWSPDGKRILFESDHEHLNQLCNNDQVCYYDEKLYTMNPDGSKLKRITSNKLVGSEYGAEWSPDGSRIVFDSDRNGRYVGGDSYYNYYGTSEIYSIRTDGKCLTWLTNGSPASYSPVWGPEADRSTSPGHCGARSRPPLVEGKPGPWLNPDSSPTSMKRLWLGPSYETMLYTSDDGYYGPNGAEIHYEDCGRYFISACGLPIAVASERVCPTSRYSENSDGNMVVGGYFDSLIERHGALVMKSEADSDGYSELLVLTGGQAVSVTTGANLFHESKLEAIDALRPVGAEDASQPLAPARLDQGLINRATTITAYFGETGSVASTAEHFHILADSVRSFLRFYDEVQRIGPVDTITCPAVKDDD